MSKFWKVKTAGVRNRSRRAWLQIEEIEVRTLLSGLSIAGSQYWHQDQPILDFGEEGDRFGGTVAVGDFNDDGFQDLAVGVPGESVNGKLSAGAVNVIYGSAGKLVADGNQFWHQDVENTKDEAETNDRFGAALAVGNFNGDRFDDLAIGVPGDEINDRVEAGGVAIIYGSPEGLTTANDQFWHQDIENVKGDAETGDHFGASLAAGDFDRDGFDDLAIGIPDDEINNRDEAGGVAVVYGSQDGLTTANDQFVHQDVDGILGDAEAGDHFGAALATGDFDRDGYDDLAIGAPDDEINNQNRAGGVAVLYGSRNRLTADDDQFWHQDSQGLREESETGDRFGAALTAGDFDGDGFEDLAIGVPDEDINGIDNAGAVHIIYGNTNGLASGQNQLWYQNDAGINETAEPNDRFGTSLASGDLHNGDDVDELVVGVPAENVVILLQGIRGEGVTGLNSLTWRQSDLGLVVDVGEQFGASLAVGNFNGDRFLDLAVGVPFDRPNLVRSGAVSTLYGTPDTTVPSGTPDATGPSVTIDQAATQGDPASGSVVNFAVQFSEAVFGFTNADVALHGTAGATTVVVTGSGASYQVAVSGMVRSGTVIASIPAGVAVDALGNPNRPSTSTDNTVNYQVPKTVASSITQAGGQDDPTSDTVIRFVAAFGQFVFGFTGSDIQLGGTAGATSAVVGLFVGGDGTLYEVIVSGMVRSGTVIASITAGVVVDSFGNPNQASTSLDNVVTYQKPIAVTINQAPGQDDPTDDSEINFVVEFSEPVSGFTSADVELGGAAGATTAVVTGSGAVYQVAVSGMTQTGSVIASIPAGVAINAVGGVNQHSTSDDNTVMFDVRPRIVGWTNVKNPLDVTNDGIATSLDALRIINELNSRRFSGEDGKLPSLDTIPPDPPAYIDVNGDGFVTPRDVLQILNHLNRRN